MKKKIKVRTKFILLLGIFLAPSLIYAQELKVLDHIHAESVGKGYNLAISPDGKFIAFQELKSLTIKVMDLETKKIIAELKDANQILYLTFTPDSRSVAMYLVQTPIIRIWNFKEKAEPKGVFTLTLPEKAALEAIPPFVFSPNGKYLAIGSGGIDLMRKAIKGEQITEEDVQKAKGKIYLWNTTERKIITILESPIPYGEKLCGVNGLAFSLDSRYLVSRCGRRLSVWDLYDEVLSKEAKRLMLERAKARFREVTSGPPDPMWDPFLDKELQNLIKERKFKELMLSPYLLLEMTNTVSPGESPILFSSNRKYLIYLERGGVYRYDFTPEEWKEKLELANLIKKLFMDVFIIGPIKNAAGEEWGLLLDKLGEKINEMLETGSLRFQVPFKTFDIPPYGSNYPLYRGATRGDFIAIGVRGNGPRPVAPGLLLTVSELKEVASFTTIKDPINIRFDFTELIYLFPDGKRLFTYNNREGIYIFDISTLKL